MTPDLPLLVFDGDCGFCTWVAGWVSARWPEGAGRTAPWQRVGEESLAALGLTVDEVKSAAWWIDGGGRRFRGHRAIGKALVACGGLHRVLGGVILVPPTSWIAAGVYRLVVRYRYRLPGATPACRLQ
jgi:predicted DCC family thiol-disulfide oxidoreductase YuxK